MIIIKTFVPSYFKKFKCVADKCPDTCCAGWEVNLDDDSAQYYKSVKNIFGEKLRSCLDVDDDGDYIFTLTSGERCPFLNSKNLCDIYSSLGEKSLCKTCTLFPRFYDDYGSFCEMGIGLGCPEAAKILLENNEHIVLEQYEDFDIEEHEVDADLLKTLLSARNEMFLILKSDGCFKIKLSNLLQYAADVQKNIDGDYFEEVKTGLGFDYCVDILSKMEYISNERKVLFEQLNKVDVENDIFNIFEKDFVMLLEYYIYRYMLKALYDGDLLTKVKYAAFACAVIGRLYSVNSTKENRIKAIYSFSKEVEYSDINMEILDSELYENFGIDDLIELF